MKWIDQNVAFFELPSGYRAPTVAGDEATKAEPVAVVRVARLAAELRVPLYHVRAMAVGADVLALEAPVALPEAEAIARRVAQHPDVEYAHPDRILRWHLVPNDPYIGSQTYLDNGPVSISAYAAWDVTTGSPNTTVAVVDSGYTDHPAMAGRFLPGYDFVSSAFYGADGDGRDPDAHDPGDWASNADDGMAVYPNDCYPYSLWHGSAMT